MLLGLAAFTVQVAIVTFNDVRLDAQEHKPKVQVPPPGTNGAGDGDVRNVPQAPPTTEPKVSDASHAKIRDIQLQQKGIEAQYLQTQQQLSKLEAQFNALGPQLNEALDAAYKEAGVKREDWSLDIQTLKFSKIEKKPPEVKK